MAEKKKDKSDQIISKLNTHDKQFVVITKKQEEHDKQFAVITKKLEEHDRRFEAINVRLGEHDRRFDEFGKKFDELLTGQDKIITELEKAREDRVFSIAKDREQDRRLESLEDRMQKVEVKIS
jgi:chromosome segregation ATPase